MAEPAFKFDASNLRLNDAEWSIVGPLLRLDPARGGRPSIDARRSFEGMLWIARSGLAWAQMDKQFGDWRRVKRQWTRYRAAGLIHRLLAAIPARVGAEEKAPTATLSSRPATCRSPAPAANCCST